MILFSAENTEKLFTIYLKNDRDLMLMDNTGETVHIIIMINNSRGSRGMEEQLLNGVNKFISLFTGEAATSFSIILYNQNTRWLRHHTDASHARLKAGEIRISNKSSSLYDSIYKVMRVIEQAGYQSSKNYLVIQIDADDHTSNITAGQILRELKAKRKNGWECMLLTADRVPEQLYSNHVLPYLSSHSTRAFETVAKAIKRRRTSFDEQEVEMNLK